MAKRTTPRRPRSQPPKHDGAQEWPVDDDDMEAMGDAALDEPAMGTMEVRGGSDPDEGFGSSFSEMRRRAAVLEACPDVRNALSARRRKAFLMALAQTGVVSMACAAAGWSRSMAMSLRKGDEEFREQWDHSLAVAGDILHTAALHRAVHGVQEDVWHKPKEGSPVVIGHKTIYSDRLLETLLKAAKPAEFNPAQHVKVEGGKGGVLVLPAAPENIEDFEAAAYRQQAQFREKRDDE